MTFVVAVAENGVIGRDGQLPWRLPSDLKRFRKLTLGKPVIMGRKTYESIGKPLDGRDNIVVSRGSDFSRPACMWAVLDHAIALGHKLAAGGRADEVAVIGGADVFAAALPQADRIYLTASTARPAGDMYFPPSTPLWSRTPASPCAGPKDQFSADFVVLERQELNRHSLA